MIKIWATLTGQRPRYSFSINLTKHDAITVIAAVIAIAGGLAYAVVLLTAGRREMLVFELDVIGVAGSVAVGKSTTARVLQALLARWEHHPRVDLVTTDGFLYSTAELMRRGILHRKGFPESYDRRKLLRFVTEVKSGAEEVAAPVYSHVSYDIVKGQFHMVRQPDILIVEGLRERDEFVLNTAAESETAVAVTLAGGYAINPSDTVAIHCGTVEAALA